MKIQPINSNYSSNIYPVKNVKTADKLCGQPSFRANISSRQGEKIILAGLGASWGVLLSSFFSPVGTAITAFACGVLAYCSEDICDKYNEFKKKRKTHIM